MTAGLEVTGLQAGYGAIPVLRGLDLEARPGEILGVAGLNGAGKTTLLRALSGVIPRRADRLALAGVALPSSPKQIARRGLIHVPEGRHVFASMTVRENLQYGAAAAARRDEAPRRLERMLTVFPRLAELADRRAGLLSGGEQQMLVIARGLMAAPSVLMVDELSLGLSPRAGREIYEVLTRVARHEGLALLLVDQNIALLTEHCDRVNVVRDGLAEPLDDSHDRETINAAYF